MASHRPRNILVVDIGGSNVKLMATGRKERLKFASGPLLTPAQMVRTACRLTRGWTYDAVAIGYPGPVTDHRPTVEPHNLGRGWVRFDFARAFRKPVKIINDAALQALGYGQTGRVLFLGLGTGFGSALVIDGRVVPLELCQLRFSRHRTIEDVIGKRGFKGLGQKRWEKAVFDTVAMLRAAFLPDTVVIGGGNGKKLINLPPGCRRGDNRHAYFGGLRVWGLEPSAAERRSLARATAAAPAKKPGPPPKS